METSTLSETDAGTYIDRTGDIVLVFTDRDGKNKSLILQRDTEQGFGSFTHMDDGYYEEDYSPYMPARLFLPNIKRPDMPAYSIEEIERDEECDGAWIGDQGTLIIHRMESDPYRMLHIMFAYDTHNELKFVLYSFSPIFSRFGKTEQFRPIMADEHLLVVPATHEDTKDAAALYHTPDTLRDRLDDIQKQIDRIGEKVSNALRFAQNSQMIAENIVARVSKIEQENNAPGARDMPDTEGFWRDSDGDVWVRDTAGTALLIAKGHKEGTNEIYDLPHCPDGVLRECGPYVKIDNPFIQGEDHAD